MLFVSDRLIETERAPAPVIRGASHERGFRAGTEAIHQIAGLGAAARWVLADIDEGALKLRTRRDRLHELLANDVPQLALHGPKRERLPNTLNVGFPGLTGADLLEAADVVEASVGSACHAGETRPSPVLEAMRVPLESARGAVRLSLGRLTTDEEIERAAAALVNAWRSLGGK